MDGVIARIAEWAERPLTFKQRPMYVMEASPEAEYA